MATRDTYQVQEWEDLPSENTPISGERLSHIEQGIKNAMDNRALKEIYNDNAINLGRKAGTQIGIKSTSGGQNTTASGYCSDSWGEYSVSSGNCSHSEGEGTIARGENSHSEGKGTIARGDEQHVSGRYNREDYDNKFAEIVGDGTGTSDRKNIRTLDWQGNAMYAGTVESQGLILTDPTTEQKYKLTVENGNIAITAIE